MGRGRKCCYGNPDKWTEVLIEATGLASQFLLSSVNCVFFSLSVGRNVNGTGSGPNLLQPVTISPTELRVVQ